MDAQRAAGAAVAQSLFIRTGPDGHTWEFASLADGGCALLRDGHVVSAGDGSDDAVALVLREFLTASGACPAAAGAPPEPAEPDQSDARRDPPPPDRSAPRAA